MYKAILLHLSHNMWEETPEPLMMGMETTQYLYPQHYDRMEQYCRDRAGSDTLKCEDDVWRRVTARFAQADGNMVVIDVGDGVQYESHPEIAVKGAWSTGKLKAELERLRCLGLEPIPKLNFSTCHDAWMHDYGRMVSTMRYYTFCHDIIREVAGLFGGPRFFHIGMDEETGADQAGEGYALKVVRADRLLWHDLRFLCDEVRATGARPWMWADKLWSTEPEVFAAEVPHDVLQSNWYYKEVTDFTDETRDYILAEKKRVEAFALLERLGYEQFPCGSNWARVENYPRLVEFCQQTLQPQHLLGFLMAPWYMTRSVVEPWLNEACDICKDVHTKIQ